ncbi:hypothetical protein ACFL5L_06310, partial [candidate division KSB1 bacterium]
MKHKLWRRDVLFMAMEPVLLVFLGEYVLIGSYPLLFMQKVYNWLTVYIVFQALLIFIKSAYSFHLVKEVSRWRG